jgi:hypothetical protein
MSFFGEKGTVGNKTMKKKKKQCNNEKVLMVIIEC